jgi:ATP-dependent Lon protease
MTEGSGKFDVTGMQSAKETKESVKTAQNYFRANAKQISASISVDSKDYMMHIQDCQGVGLDSNVSLATMTAYCSCALDKPVLPQMCILGSMSIGGTINKVEELASTLQVAFDAGAKRIIIPMSSAADIATVPADLFAKFQISFYSSRGCSS